MLGGSCLSQNGVEENGLNAGVRLTEEMGPIPIALREDLPWWKWGELG